MHSLDLGTSALLLLLLNLGF